MSALHVVMLGSSSANNFGLAAGEGTTDLLRTHLQSVRSSHCRVTLLAQNGMGLTEQCPTGYSVPASLPAVNTSFNVTFALARRPDAVIIWQPAANMPEYQQAPFSFTTVGQFENAIDTDMIPAMQAIQTACVNQGVAFFCIGSHPSGAGAIPSNISVAQATGRHYWDMRLAAVFGTSYIDGGWNRYAVGSTYNNSTAEKATPGTMDAGSDSHFTAATSSDFFTNIIVPRGFAELRDRRNAIDVVP